MTSERLRLFLGVALPDEVLAALDDATAPLRASLAEARWVSLANQHVTLKFLGGTDAELVGRVEDAARSAAREIRPWHTSLTGLGAFPNVRRARVLWAGLDDAHATMRTLAAELAAACEPLGFEPEKRAFTPHLTLARFRVPRPLPELPDLAQEVRRPFVVEGLNLYRSHLSPKGARYEVLTSLPFEGAT